MDVIRTSDGSLTLHSARYGQTFHSHHGALAEARHVFLAASGVGARLAAGRATRVLEVGFGTGLNFVLTAAAARAGGAPLAYVALEHDLLPAEALAPLAYGRATGAEALWQALLAWRRELPDEPPPGRHEAWLAEGVTVAVIVGDASGADLGGEAFDAVYQDAFSPRANPELWTPAFFARLAAAMRPGARLATYSASGDVRRALAAAGLAVEKRPGPPGGKRETVVAERPAPADGK